MDEYPVHRMLVLLQAKVFLSILFPWENSSVFRARIGAIKRGAGVSCVAHGQTWPRSGHGRPQWAYARVHERRR
jgi:hypothetical protein